MGVMKASSFVAGALMVLVLVLMVWAADGARPSEAQNGRSTSTSSATTPSVRATFEPAKLFDFENYKRLFKKTYSGFLEELARKKYFLSRAFRAFVSAIKYKYRQAGYYLAINWLSDASPKELDRMRNKVIESSGTKSRTREPLAAQKTEGQAEAGSERPIEIPPSKAQDVERELRHLAESPQTSGPGFDELKSMFGLKKEERAGVNASAAAAAAGRRVRELDMDRLIETGERPLLDPETAGKIKTKVASNNPNYEPVELHSFGLVDQQELVSVWTIERWEDERNETASDWVTSSVAKELGRLTSEVAPRNSGLEDEVFVDLRDTKCFFLPRQQGSCGACYAFTVIAIIEWLYCMKTGNLVAFSEQYMIDCGNAYSNTLDGCDGGGVLSAADFVTNFGLELRNKYPYQMADGQCPYEPDMDLEKTGYIRFEFDDMASVHVDLLASVLANGPVALTISLAAGFHEYGGGVHGFGCDQLMPSHAVVLIGHGREDGHEYWLIRNSFSVGWGEAGHYKLAKKANCIHPEYGTQYATRDGLSTSAIIEENVYHDRMAIKRRKHQLRARNEP